MVIAAKFNLSQAKVSRVIKKVKKYVERREKMGRVTADEIMEEEMPDRLDAFKPKVDTYTEDEIKHNPELYVPLPKYEEMELRYKKEIENWEKLFTQAEKDYKEFGDKLKKEIDHLNNLRISSDIENEQLRIGIINLVKNMK